MKGKGSEFKDEIVIEALDRSYNAQLYIEKFLGEHPLIAANAELVQKVQKASNILAEVYQLIGSQYID